MTPLEQFAGDLARTQRDALTFSPKPIVGIPHDPIAHAVLAMEAGTADLTFAVIEAFAARDGEGMTHLQAHIQRVADQVVVLETMAKDLASRMKE